jgi:single-strand DNA-binding protein
MLNKTILIGRLTRDLELRYTSGGTAVATFSLAVERPFTNQQGEREVDYIDIVVWGKTAENCANHLGKGRLVAVDGRIQIRPYETKEGQKRKAFEVVAETVRFLDWPKEGNGSTTARNTGTYGGSFSSSVDVPYEDLPF